MSKKVAKFVLNLVLIIFLVGIAFLIFNSNKIKIDSDLGLFKSEKEFDVTLNGKEVQFSIKSYSQSETNKNYLFYASSIFKTRRVEIVGFEDNIDLCNKPVIKFGGKDVFCLVGDVGAHSQNIVFIDENMSPIKIRENGIELANIVTDSPSYQLTDINNDGTDDLVLDNRDYDKNPLVDVIRTYYIWASNGFIFDKAEKIEVK